MSTIESYSKVIKRKDPKTVLLPMYILLAMSIAAGLLVPFSWLDTGANLSYLLNMSVLGAAIFFFAQDKKSWKSTAIVLCLAVIILEALVLIRFECQYDFLFITAPKQTIAERFQGQQLINTFARNILY